VPEAATAATPPLPSAPRARTKAASSAPICPGRGAQTQQVERGDDLPRHQAVRRAGSLPCWSDAAKVHHVAWSCWAWSSCTAAPAPAEPLAQVKERWQVTVTGQGELPPPPLKACPAHLRATAQLLSRRGLLVFLVGLHFLVSISPSRQGSTNAIKLLSHRTHLCVRPAPLIDEPVTAVATDPLQFIHREL
jgi:hypothetical protein